MQIKADWILLAIFLLIIFVFTSRGTVVERFEGALDPTVEVGITKKDKKPTCPEAAIAYAVIMRYIVNEPTGNGSILLKNMKDVFFEVDSTGTNPVIGIRGDFDAEKIYSSWTNPLKCSL